MQLEQITKPLMDAGFTTAEVIALMAAAEHVTHMLKQEHDLGFKGCYGTVACDTLRRMCD